MSYIDTLLQAYNITDDVFQQRGFGKDKVDLIKYLKTSDRHVFTCANGARALIEKVSLQEMNS